MFAAPILDTPRSFFAFALLPYSLPLSDCTLTALPPYLLLHSLSQAMAGLRVPIVTLLAGEGGSGGALGIGMGNTVGMLSGGYFGVISPEGAASILGRYDNDEDKARRFPLDCQELAKAQCIYADQLQALGVVDEIIWEPRGAAKESYTDFPVLKARIHAFLQKSFAHLLSLSSDQLVAQRYAKYRAMGTFEVLDSAEARQNAVSVAKSRAGTGKKLGGGAAAAGARGKAAGDETLRSLLTFIADTTVSGSSSRYRGNMGGSGKCPEVAPECPPFPAPSSPPENAKSVLDRAGPEALARWVRGQTRVLVTDTTMRDAHQSLCATRVRTEDLVSAMTCNHDMLFPVTNEIPPCLHMLP
jgi:hypothetical protein